MGGAMAAKKKKATQKKASMTTKTAPKKPVKKRAPAATSQATKKKKASPSDDGGEGDVPAYQHDDTRKNNPPAGLVEFDRPPPKKKKDYSYDPHLDPQLQWAGKAEHTSFEVDTVSLHIHERISTQAILRAVRREDAPPPGQPQLNLFAKPDLPQSKEVDFYGHDVGWANRLVLGDSLIVMNSLLEREHMAGQVQCIFMDPPYGVKFNSNFQPSISRRDVKDGDDGSLTREPEQIQAYRDTWELGVHSYLTYLRDRLLLVRELLSQSGSVFVQISDENVHHVREIMDEIFGPANFVSLITFAKTSGQTDAALASVSDYLLWYARDASNVKFRRLYTHKGGGDAGAGVYRQLENRTGERRLMTPEERRDPSLVPEEWRIFRLDNLTSPRIREARTGYFPVAFGGKQILPGQGEWKTNQEGMKRLVLARRVAASGNSLAYVRFLDDFPVQPISNSWSDTGTGSFTDDKVYVVQTGAKAIMRCLLMTTDPGDLVLDPTCGSGTTAFVAEQWGRRWITCDTSRVALSLARQRILTAKYPFYELRSSKVKDGFRYKTVPHITLKSIAQNPRIDACTNQAEINKVIAESADQETLFDQPFEDKKRVRVAGPFTVEAIPLPSMEDLSRDIDGEASKGAAVPGGFSQDVNQYLTMLMDLLRQTGVNFPGNKRLRLPTLRAVKGAYEWFHAEGTSDMEGDPRSFAVSFGPRHGPVSTTQVLEAMREARGKDVLLFCGFACDPEARKIIDQGIHGMELVFAHAAPDILVGDLLKKKKTDQLFAVFGAPDIIAHGEAEGRVSVEVRGIDLYDPITGDTDFAKGESAAAIFVDHDYDGKTFCVSQALFPGGGSNAWEKLQKALKGSIDEDKFSALRTTRSLPFKPGLKVAVKVIDDRGNEVIKMVDARKSLKKQ